MVRGGSVGSLLVHSRHSIRTRTLHAARGTHVFKPIHVLKPGLRKPLLRPSLGPRRCVPKIPTARHHTPLHSSPSSSRSGRLHSTALLFALSHSLPSLSRCGRVSPNHPPFPSGCVCRAHAVRRIRLPFPQDDARAAHASQTRAPASASKAPSPG